MYRLLIVDDDEILRNGLLANVNWAGNGIQVVADARNGKEALEKIDLYMPEIILSDIRMPFMDGIELAKYVYEYHPEIKIILLTAYEEFEYARKAIQYHVSDYILKYESNEAILNQVKKLIVQYEMDRKHREIENTNQSYRIKDVIGQMCFHEMDESFLQDSDCLNILKQCRPDFMSGEYMVMIAAVQDEIKKDEHQNQRYMEGQRIIQTVEDSLKKQGILFEAYQDKEYIRFVINDHKKCCADLQKFQQLLVENVNSLEQQGVRILLGCGGVYSNITEIYKSYMEAEEVLSTLQIMKKSGTDVRIKMYGQVRDKKQSMADTIEKVIAFIQQHYADYDLSLETIASQVFLSASYLSTLFKKYKNINISNYIIQVRMEIAMKMLLETDDRTYEIADKIGYTNAQYFSILFKKSTGETPTEYRDKRQKH